MIHHLEHLVVYSLVLWQVTLAVYLILKWLKDNESDEKIVDTPHIYTGVRSDKKPKGKTLGAVEVDLAKTVIVEKADSANIKSDEVIKAKVKTKKNKLKELRR